MILIGLIIITAALTAIVVPRIRQKLLAPAASRSGESGTPAVASGASMNAVTSRDFDAAGMLALARLDDDGEPPAVRRPQVGDSHEPDTIRRVRVRPVAARQAETATIASGDGSRRPRRRPGH